MDNTLQFFGATKQVTGSKFLLEVNHLKILVDCGIDMEQRDEEGQLPPFDFNPKTIDVLLLTHAHIDHSGLIPLLVKQGFDGLIYCTYATYHLTEILLFDIARINLRKTRGRKGRPMADFYGPREVEDCLDYFHPIDLEHEMALNDEVSFYFRNAGHLLGAAHIILKSGDETIVFSGDIGRPGYPLLQNPQPIPPADYVICETTYGMRVHQDKNPEQIIGKIIHDACVTVPGRLIIPSFSVGRTQTLLYILHRLQAAGKLPPIRVFTDSPLARKSTQVYQDFVEYLNGEAHHFHKKQGSLFDLDNLIYLDDMNSAEEIDNYTEPCIIITSSGMVKGGKSEEHIFRNLENSYCTLLFIGYCAKGTLGRRLIEGMKTFRRNGEELKVSARILSTDVLSGHGDFNDLMNFFRTQDKHHLKKVFLVHGDEDAMENFRHSLEHWGVNDVVVPEYGDQYKLTD